MSEWHLTECGYTKVWPNTNVWVTPDCMWPNTNAHIVQHCLQLVADLATKITPSIVALSDEAHLISRYVDSDKATSRVVGTGKMKADSRLARQPITACHHHICRQPATTLLLCFLKAFYWNTLSVAKIIKRQWWTKKWVWNIGEMILTGKWKHSEIKLAHWHFVHRKFHMDRAGIGPGLPHCFFFKMPFNLIFPFETSALTVSSVRVSCYSFLRIAYLRMRGNGWAHSISNNNMADAGNCEAGVSLAAPTESSEQCTVMYQWEMCLFFRVRSSKWQTWKNIRNCWFDKQKYRNGWNWVQCRKLTDVVGRWAVRQVAMMVRLGQTNLTQAHKCAYIQYVSNKF